MRRRDRSEALRECGLAVAVEGDEARQRFFQPFVLFDKTENTAIDISGHLGGYTIEGLCMHPVSYTHLDVYKRQRPGNEDDRSQ